MENRILRCVIKWSSTTRSWEFIKYSKFEISLLSHEIIADSALNIFTNGRSRLKCIEQKFSFLEIHNEWITSLENDFKSGWTVQNGCSPVVLYFVVDHAKHEFLFSDCHNLAVWCFIVDFGSRTNRRVCYHSNCFHLLLFEKMKMLFFVPL